MNTGILLRSYPAVSQCVVSSVARKIAPGIHSGRSRGAAVFESSGGASPAAPARAVSGYAFLNDRPGAARLALALEAEDFKLAVTRQPILIGGR
ncbi:MAG TPA: hypothetical protein VKC15_13140, partial [Gemmatimonadales bacterium]|nr:hypothetical protein [Gemmatimonadales bacterium]